MRARALVVLEPLDGVGDDPTAAAREAHHALERRERARRGLRRTALAAQQVQQLSDVVDRDRGDPPPPERREQVAVELVAVRLERARVALADRVLAIRLAIDAALHPNAAGGARSHPPCLGSRPSPRDAPPDIKL